MPEGLTLPGSLPGMVLIIIELKGLHPRKPSIPRQLKKFGHVGLTKSSK